MPRLLLAVMVCFLGAASAGAAVRWRAALQQKPDWYGGAEAAALAESVLTYQHASGGWPKNTDFAQPLPPGAPPADGERAPTIDNGGTTTPLQFLARVESAQPEPQRRAAIERGLDYLLAAQYANGGWPQFYPLRRGYYSHITFNDHAMVNVLTLLQAVAEARAPFAWVDRARRERAAQAVAKGVACILRCQVVQDGVKTAWGAQHDATTFAPAWARKFEPPSLASHESAGVVEFLMSLPEPTPEIIASVEAAVAWLRQVQLTGLRYETVDAPDQPGGQDRLPVADAKAGPLWARFYELGTNRPIFIGRDAVIRYDVREIEHERRTGYAWYVTSPQRVLAQVHPAWRARLAANTRAP